jgi:hypothetical protein
MPSKTATKEISESSVAKEGKMYLELIQSVNPIIPQKGSNAGKQMFVINGKHWHSIEPKAEDTHVCLQGVTLEDGREFVNVTGFSKDSRMSIADKIKLVTSNEAGYAQAIAFLLK